MFKLSTYLDGSQESFNKVRSAARKFFAGTAAISVMFLGLVIASPAHAVTQGTFDIRVVDISDVPLANISGSACTYNGPRTCVSFTTDVSGNATVTVNMADENQYAYIYAGNLASPLVIGSNRVSFNNGTPSYQNGLTFVKIKIQPKFTLQGTLTYNGQPVSNKAFSFRYSSADSNGGCVDFTTNSSGEYSLSNFPSAEPSLSSSDCSNYVSKFDQLNTPFTYIDSSPSLQIFSPTLTRTGITVSATSGGQPARNVELTAIEPGQSYGAIATTDSSGSAVFVNLIPGRSYVIKHSPLSGSNQKYLAATGETVTVASTNSLIATSLDLQLVSGFPATPVLIEGTIVTGVSNTPVSGATVSAYASYGQGSNMRSVNQSTRTDANGHYLIEDLPYGQASINIQATGYRNASFYFPTSLAEGNTYTQDFNLRQIVAGNLSYAGTLEDQNGQPVIGRSVSLGSMASSGNIPSVQTDSSGVFEFNGLSAGRYYLSVDTWSDNSYRQIDWRDSNVQLSVSDTSNVIVLQSRQLSGNASISGRVATYAESSGVNTAVGLADKSVNVHPEGGGQGFQTTTDVDGSWSVTGLDENQKYWIWVQYDNSLYEYPISSTNSVTATTAGGSHELLLKSIASGTGSLSGRIKDSLTYKNLANVPVSIYRHLGGYTHDPAVSNEKGEYSFTDLPPGNYFLQVGEWSGEYNTAWMTAEIGSEANRVNALLQPKNTYGGTITGRILDDRGLPLPGANVQVWDPTNSDLGGYASTNSRGDYTLLGIPTGSPLSFRVSPGYNIDDLVASHFETVTFPQGSTTLTKNATLSAAGVISGQVSGIPSRGNVPPVFAELIDAASGNIVTNTYVDASRAGTFSIPSLPAGSYKIRFTQQPAASFYTGSGGGASSGGDESELISLKPVYFDGSLNGATNEEDATTIVLASGGTRSDLTVTMTAGAAIVGDVSIQSPDGALPLRGTRGVTVTLYKQSAVGGWSAIGYPTSVNGYTLSKLSIAGLSPGNYKLKFEDTQKGNNALSTVYNGGSSSLSGAPVISVSGISWKAINQTMKIAPPERSAEAFDLDDLGAASLAELQNQITVDSEVSLGNSESIFVGTELAGEYVSVFANSTPTNLGGWKQVDSDGYISVTIPVDLEQGLHRIAVQDANLRVIGWSAVVISASETEAGVLEYSPRKAVSNTEKVVAENPTSSTLKKTSTPTEKSIEVAAQNSVAPENNVWLMYVLGLALLLGVAGAFWLLRSRRS
jgi:hypothetical protein